MALKDKMSVGRKGEVVTSNATGGQEIPTPEVNTTTDPRSKILTNQEAPFNKIAVGEDCTRHLSLRGCLHNEQMQQLVDNKRANYIGADIVVVVGILWLTLSHMEHVH